MFKRRELVSVDTQGVVGVIVAVILFYVILLALSTIIYSKLTSIRIVNPLRKLSNSARRLRDGDYSVSLRKQSEENRKKLVLDISHDLKNPLASIMGYAELFTNKPDLSKEERSAYTKVIYDNSVRANNLNTDLFELSKMESSDYAINKTRVDICEYLREKIGTFILTLEKVEFSYDFNVPENEIFLEIDIRQMNRVFPKGTRVSINLFEHDDEIVIIFKDNGIGIPTNIANDIFRPFVRADRARNSQTGGTGLGLAIVEKIIVAHGGKISLITDENCGCEFIINIPKI